MCITKVSQMLKHRGITDCSSRALIPPRSSVASDQQSITHDLDLQVGKHQFPSSVDHYLNQLAGWVTRVFADLVDERTRTCLVLRRRRRLVRRRKVVQQRHLHLIHIKQIEPYNFKLSPRGRRDDMPAPRRWQFDSRRIYVRQRTGPQSAHVLWSAVANL